MIALSIQTDPAVITLVLNQIGQLSREQQSIIWKTTNKSGENNLIFVLRHAAYLNATKQETWSSSQFMINLLLEQCSHKEIIQCLDEFCEEIIQCLDEFCDWPEVVDTITTERPDILSDILYSASGRLTTYKQRLSFKDWLMKNKDSLEVFPFCLISQQLSDRTITINLDHGTQVYYDKAGFDEYIKSKEEQIDDAFEQAMTQYVDIYNDAINMDDINILDSLPCNVSHVFKEHLKKRTQNSDIDDIIIEELKLGLYDVGKKGIIGSHVINISLSLYFDQERKMYLTSTKVDEVTNFEGSGEINPPQLKQFVDDQYQAYLAYQFDEFEKLLQGEIRDAIEFIDNNHFILLESMASQEGKRTILSMALHNQCDEMVQYVIKNMPKAIHAKKSYNTFNRLFSSAQERGKIAFLKSSQKPMSPLMVP